MGKTFAPENAPTPARSAIGFPILPTGHGVLDPNTREAIRLHQHGQALREGKMTRAEVDENPELGYSPDARTNVGFMFQGSAVRKIKEINPGLTDSGIEQLLRKAPTLYSVDKNERE